MTLSAIFTIPDTVRFDMKNHISTRIVVYLLMSLFFASVAWGSNFPLEPPDTSSPRATLRNFLKHSDRFASSMPDPYSMSPEAQEALEGAISSLNLSKIAPSHVEDVGVESALLLREILDRLELLDLNEVPDKEEIKELGLGQWRIPQTEITIAKVDQGSKAGSFLFTPETIARLEEWYAKVQDLPYQEGVNIPFPQRVVHLESEAPQIQGSSMEEDGK